MRMSFYGFLTNFVLGRDTSPEAEFAKRAANDAEFPVHAGYRLIRQYVSKNAESPEDTDTFDRLWYEYCVKYYSAGKKATEKCRGHHDGRLIRLQDIAFREGFDIDALIGHVCRPPIDGVRKDNTGIWCVEAEHEREVIEHERKCRKSQGGDNFYRRCRSAYRSRTKAGKESAGKEAGKSILRS